MPGERRVRDTRVEVWDAEGRPRSAAPRRGAGAWPPPARLGGKWAFQKRSGSLSISWGWAWISLQKRLAFAAAKGAQSNFTEQLTVSLSELIAAKEYCGIWTESKFPPTNLRLQRESSQTEGNDSFPKGKYLHDEDFQTRSPDCLPLLQLISNYFNQNNYICLNCLFCVLPLRWVQRGKKNMEIHFKSSSKI